MRYKPGAPVDPQITIRIHCVCNRLEVHLARKTLQYQRLQYPAVCYAVCGPMVGGAILLRGSAVFSTALARIEQVCTVCSTAGHTLQRCRLTQSADTAPHWLPYEPSF